MVWDLETQAEAASTIIGSGAGYSYGYDSIGMESDSCGGYTKLEDKV